MRIEEPIGPICRETTSRIAYIPYYLADGNIVLKKWREPFIDRMGNKAELTKVLVITRKNKESVIVIIVKWE